MKAAMNLSLRLRGDLRIDLVDFLSSPRMGFGVGLMAFSTSFGWIDMGGFISAFLETCHDTSD